MIGSETQSNTKGKAGKGETVKRIEAGRALYLSGGVRHVAGESYLVASRSGDYDHAVDLYFERCTCKDSRVGKGGLYGCAHFWGAAIAHQLPEGFEVKQVYGRFGYLYKLIGPAGECRGLHLSLAEAIDFAAEVAGEVAKA